MKASEITPEVITRLSKAPEGTVIQFDDGTYVKQGEQLVRQGETTQPSSEPRGLASRIGSGVTEGLVSTAKGIAAIPGALAGTPGQVVRDIGSLISSPATAIPEQFQRAKSFAVGMIPMRQTLGGLLTGEVPPAEEVSKEATEFGAGYLLGKYLIPGMVGTTKKVIKSLPGSSVELNELAASKLRDIPGQVAPSPGAVPHAYQLLDMVQAPNVAMNETLATAQKLLAKEMSLAAPDRQFLRSLRGVIDKAQAGMPFKDIQANVVDFGEKIGQITANKGTKLGEMKDLLSALHEDAANAIPMGGTLGAPSPALQVKSQIWDAARLLARRQFASNDLTRMIEKAGISTVGDGFTQVNTNRIVSSIEDMMKLASTDKKAKLFVGSFQPGELESIVDTLKAIGKEAPKVPAKAGAPVGSSQRWLEAGMGGIAGTVVGGIAGHPGMGATIGSLSGPLASHLIAKAMMSDAGRALVRRMVTPTGSISPQAALAIGAFIKGEAERGSE